MCEIRPDSQLEDWLGLLKANGFDKSDFGPECDTIAVSCSQCEALVVNGVAIHEKGCPNERVETKCFECGNTFHARKGYRVCDSCAEGGEPDDGS